MRAACIDRIVVINDLARSMGGASALALLSARGFRARGHAVTLLVGDAGDHDGALAALGIDCVALGQDRLLTRPRIEAAMAALWNRQAAQMIAGWIRRHDTPQTVYHLHGWLQILSPAVFRALAPVRDRLVISAHDFFLACPNGAFADLRSGTPCPHRPLTRACLLSACDRHSHAHKLLRVVRHAIQTWVLDPRAAPPILAIHHGMAPLLARAGIPPASIHTLPNPVTPWSATRIPAEANRYALLVGRLEKTKGADLAAAAARAAGLPLRVIGTGALEPSLRMHYPEVRFHGRQPPVEIARIAAQARLLVMPSRYPEPFGLVAMEAARSGLPVILPPTALLAPDLVARGAGIAVDPRDPVGFAGILTILAADDQRVAAMSEAAFTQTGDLALSPAEWVEALLAFYAGRLAALRADQSNAAPPCPGLRVTMARAADDAAGTDRDRPVSSSPSRR